MTDATRRTAVSEPQLRAPMLEENARLRAQAEALAEALDEQDAVRVTPYEVDLAVKMFNRNGGRWESESDEELVMKWEWRKRNAIELDHCCPSRVPGGDAMTPQGRPGS